MKQIYYRKIRIFVSLLFFVMTSLLFLELSGSFVQLFSDEILFFQFIPSFLSFFHLVSISAIGFIIVIIITLLWGRVYCSSICPLGVLIDLISFFKRKIQKIRKQKKERYKFKNPHNYLRYSILAIVVIMFLAGSTFGIVILDPYSNFGRIITNFVRPVFIEINNFAVLILEMFDNYSLVPYKHGLFSVSTIVFPILFLTLIFYLTIKSGRLYCNTICPIGSLLGIISKFTFFKIKIDENSCIECGKCETVCKANCINSDTKEIDFTRCVSCFNCFESCPTGGLKYLAPLKINSNSSKRNFFISVGLLSLSLFKKTSAQAKEIFVYKENTIPEKRELPITPPGSKGIEHFLSNCTACTLCVSACPTHVLQPTLFEYGIEGFLMPHLLNTAGFCNYECTICGDICPNEAIVPVEKEEKKLIQIGKAEFIKDNCVVHTQKTDCGACAEHCPTQAVKMVFSPELNLRIPEVDIKICIGCGACEFACPTKPYKAIYVVGNFVHQLAEKPNQEKLEHPVSEEDFPF